MVHDGSDDDGRTIADPDPTVCIFEWNPGLFPARNETISDDMIPVTNCPTSAKRFGGHRISHRLHYLIAHLGNHIF